MPSVEEEIDAALARIRQEKRSLLSQPQVTKVVDVVGARRRVRSTIAAEHGRVRVKLDPETVAKRRAERAERARLRKEREEKRKVERLRRRRHKLLKDRRSNPHRMITRSKLPHLLSKPHLTPEERIGLRHLLEYRKCATCLKRRELSCFYKNLRIFKGKSSRLNSCIECIDKGFDAQAQVSILKTIHARSSRRAKDKGLVFDLTLDDLTRLNAIQRGRCNYTGRPFFVEDIDDETKKAKYQSGVYIEVPSLDRIDPKKGYTKDNVHLVCRPINYAKLDLDDEDFITLCQDVAHVASVRGVPTRPPLVETTPECRLPTSSHPEGSEPVDG